MTKNLSKALINQRKKSEPFRKTLYGSLGIPLNGQRLVQVPNRQSYVYVRLNDNQNEVIQAFNNTVAPSYDLPVVVMREGGRYTVKQVNTQRYENNWNNSSPYLPAHGTSHSFYPGGGADVTWIYSRQIMHGLVYPNSTGTTVDISSFPLYTNNGWILAGGTGTVNLLQYLPVTGSSALMVLLYADSSNGNPGLLVNSGTYMSYDITGSVYPYIPIPNPTTQIPLAAIRLSTGTLTVGWDNLYDVRQWIHSMPSGSSGGGGGGVEQIGIYGQNKGANLGTGTVFNVNGSRLNLSLSGTVFNLMNSPDPQELIGFYAMSSGTALGTGTILNFISPLYASITGTTVYAKSSFLLPFGSHINNNPFTTTSYPYSVTIDRTVTLSLWTQAYKVLTTNNGSNYWKLQLIRWSDDALIKEINTSAGSAGVASQVSTASFDISSIGTAGVGIYMIVSKQGTPGDLYLMCPAVKVTE